MSIELPRLPLLTFAGNTFEAFLATFQRWYASFQVWWQQVVEKIEEHEATQDALLANLETTDATITLAQAELAATQAALDITQSELSVAVAQVVAAQAAADAAQGTASTAVTDASTAAAAAAAAQATADAIAAGGPYVVQNVGPAWTAATGTASRATFATYTAPTISNPPTQAEVQAIANAVQAHSRALKAVIDDLIANGALT